MKTIILSAILILSMSSLCVAGNVKLYTDLEFSDNSVQKKAVVLPTCSSGEVYINSSGALVCGIIVPVEKGIATCVSGLCSVSGCMQGYADCDSTSTNGCESSLNTNSNCGKCGTACGLNGTCSSGVCTYSHPVSLTPNTANVALGNFISMTVTLSAPVQVDTAVTLSSNNANVSVPSQVTVLAGQTTGQFNATAISLGSSIITASLNTANVTAQVNVITSICGDGVVSGLEQCDDGNTNNGDGCSATCQIECMNGCGWVAQIWDLNMNSGNNTLTVTMKFNPIDGVNNNIWLFVDDTSIGLGVTDLMTTDLTSWGTLNLSNPINANIDFAYSGHRGASGGNLATNMAARRWVSGISYDVAGSLLITQDNTTGTYTFNIPYASIGLGAESGDIVQVYAFYGQNSANGGIHSAFPMQSPSQLVLMNSSSSTPGSGMTTLDTMAVGYYLQ